jgi:O-methyltransferase involved in polyketide biosynthesis
MEFSYSIQEAMLGPLCAKATYGKLYPELLDDPMAAEIVSKIDYNYSKI